MSDMILWMAAEAERPLGGENERQLGRRRDEEELVRTLPRHQFPGTLEKVSQNPHPSTSSGQAFSQNQGEVGHPALDKTSTQEQTGQVETWERIEDEPDVERQRRIYRNRTVAMLRRYMRYSIETGRLPSLLGREFFRSKVTSYTVVTFEDRVIFVHDMERCLDKLDDFSRDLIARLILQEHDRWATAKLLHCNEKTIRRLAPMVLDQLSEILLDVGLIDRVESKWEKACQGGNSGPFSASDCEEGKNKF
jgi:hypothetical protein